MATSRWRVPARAVIAACLLVGAAVGSSPALAAGTLTAGEVSCAAGRIQALAARTRLADEHAGGAETVPVTVLYAPGHGADLDGTAFTNLWRRDLDPAAPHFEGAGAGPEAQLAFTVTTLRDTLANPARPRLFQVGFLVEQSSASRVGPGDPRAFTLLVNPTLAADPDPASLLAINDLVPTAAQAIETDSKPGRGLQVDGITTPCAAGGYDGADLDFMGALAQRLLRPLAWNGDPGAARAYDVVGGVIREQEAGSFRLLLVARDPADGQVRGRLAVRIQAPRAFDGSLTTGSVEVLTGCTEEACTEGPARWELFVVPPSFPASPEPAAQTWSPDAPGAGHVAWSAAGGSAPGSADVGWYQLLEGTTWNPRSFVKGLALSPQGFPTDYSHLPEFFAEAASLPAAGVIWNGGWRDSAPASWDGSTPLPVPEGAELVAQQADLEGFTPLAVLGWRHGDTPNLATPGHPANDWSNSTARERYAEVAARFAAEHHPPYLFLGNENDAYFVAHPDDYSNWISAYEAAYDAVKAVSPKTLVGPVFQYENLAGRDGLTGDATPHWGALAAHHLAKVDIVGVSLYPWFGIERAEDLPEDYLAPLFAHDGGRPVVITETGWPADPPTGIAAPWTASEAEQVTFVGRLFRAIAGRDVRAAVWLYLFPPVPDGSLEFDLFGSLSLRDAAGAKRPVYDAWASR